MFGFVQANVHDLSEEEKKRYHAVKKHSYASSRPPNLYYLYNTQLCSTACKGLQKG